MFFLCFKEKWLVFLLLCMIAFFIWSCCDCPPDNCSEDNLGSNYMCWAHKGGVVTCDVGVCEVCGRGTSSGMYRLCNSCACKLKQCQRCRTPLCQCH